MKKFVIAAAVVAVLFASCAKKAETDSAPTKAEASYAFGMAIGTSIKATSVDIDYAAFVKGMKDVLDGKGGKLTQEAAEAVINKAITAAMAKAGEANLAEEKKFLEENAKKAGVFTTASGLQYTIQSEGTGAKPSATDMVSVHYEGTLRDGTVFDSSIARGEPVQFRLDQVIPGWSEGVQLMKQGGNYTFYIPSALGYGAQGAGGAIGPNQTLIFNVELLEILPPDAATDPATP